MHERAHKYAKQFSSPFPDDPKQDPQHLVFVQDNSGALANSLALNDLLIEKAYSACFILWRI